MIGGREAAVFGALGGACVEMMEFINMVRPQRRPTRKGSAACTPFTEYGPVNYVVSVVLRLVISAIVAGALGASGQLTSVVMALGAGICAPLVIEQIARFGIGLPAGMTRDKPDGHDD
jgi:hypothetical protein